MVENRSKDKETWYINCPRCQHSTKLEYKGQLHKCPVCYAPVRGEQ